MTEEYVFVKEDTEMFVQMSEKDTFFFKLHVTVMGTESNHE